MSTTTTTPTWTRIQNSEYETWYHTGAFDLLVIVTGKGNRWMWRVVDIRSGVLIAKSRRSAYRGRASRRSAETARKWAMKTMSAFDRRWLRNLSRRIYALEDALYSDDMNGHRRKELNDLIEAMRAHTRHRMIIERGGKNAVCDLCGEKPDYRGFQLHELMQRGLTVHNGPARALSYEPELSALLCADCHSRAHNPVVRDRLFQANYKRYGVERVRRVFRQLKNAYEAYGTTLGIDLPEPECQECSQQHAIRITPKEVTR